MQTELSNQRITHRYFGQLKALILLVLIAAIIMPAGFKVQAATDGAINGVIINGTAGGSSISGLTVDLYTYENNNYLNKVSNPANTDGSFSFTGLNTDAIYSYEAVCVFQGVEYTGGVIQFTANETAKTVTVTVYETTTNETTIKISLAHIVIKPLNGGLSIKEILVFNNTSDRAYVGSKIPDAAGHNEVLKFSLPPKAVDMQPSSGLSANYVVITSSGFADTTPLAPGETQLAYTYTINDVGASYQYSRLVDYPTDALDILVQGVNIQFTGSRFTASAPLDMGDTQYSFYQSNSFIKGETINFTLSGLAAAGSGSSMTTLLVVLIAVVVVGVLLAILIIQSRKKAPVNDEE